MALGEGAAVDYAEIQFGGRALSTELSLIADSYGMTASRATYEASTAAKIGVYARREQDWAFQSNLAARENTQIFKKAPRRPDTRGHGGIGS